jgi:hypothetical protein
MNSADLSKAGRARHGGRSQGPDVREPWWRPDAGAARTAHPADRTARAGRAARVDLVNGPCHSHSPRTLAAARSRATTSPRSSIREAKWVVFPPGAAHMSSTRSPGRGPRMWPTSTEGRFCRKQAEDKKLGAADDAQSSGGCCSCRWVIRTATWRGCCRIAARDRHAIPFPTRKGRTGRTSPAIAPFKTLPPRSQTTLTAVPLSTVATFEQPTRCGRGTIHWRG